MRNSTQALLRRPVANSTVVIWRRKYTTIV